MALGVAGSNPVGHPYGIAFSGGSIYVLGYSESRRAIRTLLLNRMDRVTVRNEYFQRLDGFGVEDYVGQSFGITNEGRLHDVRIEFSKAEAPGVREREWDPSQKMEEFRDGKIVLSMKVAGIPQIARWVLSYGAGARVLGPPELVREVENRLRG